MAHAFAKILLFGEHIVLQGAEALALPWSAFKGEWAWAGNQEEAPNQQRLPVFGQYLQQIQDKGLLLAPLDVESFRQDLLNGLFFASDIPTGYGAGSSGALCAALYKKYQTTEAPADLQELKRQFAQLESFFHGSSSGTDPLICYLNQAIHIIPGQGVLTMDWNLADDKTGRQDSPDLHFFVIDTGIRRQTGPWVEAFKVKAKEKAFNTRMEEVLIPASNAAIQTLLANNSSLTYQHFSTISAFHFQELPEFIPVDFQDIWQQGLASDTFKLKICGAGGGGFILGVSQQPETIHQLSQ